MFKKIKQLLKDVDATPVVIAAKARRLEAEESLEQLRARLMETDSIERRDAYDDYNRGGRNF